MDEGGVGLLAALLDLHFERHEILLRARHDALADLVSNSTLSVS
ncbi:hypothetical protein [Paraburkholderia aromaticivorans]|nr:hypothetical protein [Paraburkholderia aromaticivorans]